MDLQQYLAKKQLLEAQKLRPRLHCLRCRQPQANCYCATIHSFDPQISFVILIHPIEVARRIATGRMSHLCLQNSYLIAGEDYSHNSLVNELINDPTHKSYILYPGAQSQNLSLMSATEKTQAFSSNKKLRLFVIDGTWAKAKTTLRLSQNLTCLPQISFIPNRPSSFRVRKQPRPNFFSTIEAIHQSIELLGESQSFPVASRVHDQLLSVFDQMVEKQIQYEQTARTERSNLKGC